MQVLCHQVCNELSTPSPSTPSTPSDLKNGAPLATPGSHSTTSSFTPEDCSPCSNDECSQTSTPSHTG